jgi:hypothetical protein
MHAIDAIRIALKFSDMGMKHLESMSDAPLLRPVTVDGKPAGNHAMWIAGHLAVVEGRLQQVLHGGENPLRAWKVLFDWGSEPLDDASKYPPYAEVLGRLKEMRARTHAFLDAAGEAGLDQPTKSVPPGWKGGAFDTVGGAIAVIAGHAIGHLGALTVCRAAAGKERLFVPSEALRAY